MLRFDLYVASKLNESVYGTDTATAAFRLVEAEGAGKLR